MISETLWKLVALSVSTQNSTFLLTVFWIVYHVTYNVIHIVYDRKNENHWSLITWNTLYSVLYASSTAWAIWLSLISYLGILNLFGVWGRNTKLSNMHDQER